MLIPYRTLGIDREGDVDIVNLKCDPMLIGMLRGKSGYHPAYHMNKERWITIRLDGSAEAEEIKALVQMSWEMTSGL